MIDTIKDLLKDREFISVATCNLRNLPNAAPKFLLKIDGSFIYLIDYTHSRTWENLKDNPQVSLSFMDTETLIGYQINGLVEIISKGAAYEKIYQELQAKEIDLSTKRILEGISKQKKHKSFELAFSEKIDIFKVKIKEIVEIAPRGELKRVTVEG